MNRASACIDLYLISAIKIANSNFSNSGLLVKDIDESTFRISLWNLLSEIPQIAEPKSRHLVPIILDFRSVISDYNLILVNGKKIFFLAGGDCSTPYTCQTVLCVKRAN